MLCSLSSEKYQSREKNVAFYCIPPDIGPQSRK